MNSAQGLQATLGVACLRMILMPACYVLDKSQDAWTLSYGPRVYKAARLRS